MDIESYRDSILRSAGTLDEKMYGPSEDLDAEANIRRRCMVESRAGEWQTF